MAITKVQAFFRGDTSTGAAFNSACTAGNVIVAFTRSDANTASGVPTDTLGTVYTQVLASTSQNPHMYAYVGTLTGSGTNSVTFNGPAGSFVWNHVTEISGFTTVAVDTSEVKLGTGVTDLVSSSLTITAGGIVLVAVSQGAFTAYTAGSGYALVDRNGDSSTGGQIPTAGASAFGGVEYNLSASSGVQHITSGSSAAYTMLVVALKESGGGGGGGGTTWGPLIGGKPFSLVQG